MFAFLALSNLHVSDELPLFDQLSLVALFLQLLPFCLAQILLVPMKEKKKEETNTYERGFKKQ